MSVLCKDGLIEFWSKVKTYFTGTATPKMDGTAAVGSSSKFAREDHVHPSDTSKQDKLIAGSNITIAADGKTISASDTNTMRDAATVAPLMDGTAAVGTSMKYAREDHVHPIQTEYENQTVDCNSFLDPGLYYFDLSDTIVNGPSDALNGWLYVYVASNGAAFKQFFYRQGSQYPSSNNTYKENWFRIKENLGASWSPWVKLATGNDFTDTEKTKLSGIASGAEVNQNAFSTVKVGNTNVSADSKTDTLTLTANGQEADSADQRVIITPGEATDSIDISLTTPIWDISSASSPSAVSISNNTWTRVATISTGKRGHFLIIYGGAFVTNANGYRQLSLSLSSTSANAGRYSPSFHAVSGEQTRFQGIGIITVSASTTYYLWARQNSGGSLNVYPYLYVVEIR